MIILEIMTLFRDYWAQFLSYRAHIWHIAPTSDLTSAVPVSSRAGGCAGGEAARVRCSQAAVAAAHRAGAGAGGGWRWPESQAQSARMPALANTPGAGLESGLEQGRRGGSDGMRAGGGRGGCLREGGRRAG